MLCLQCLPRPDAAAAMAVGDAAGGETAAAISQPGAADAMLLDAVGGGGAVDALLPNPPPEAAAALGTPADLQFLAGKLRDVCTGTDELTARVRAVLAAGAGAGLGGGLMAIKLKVARLTDFVSLGKGDRVGGTWRENPYPGLNCDFPASCYCYSCYYHYY